MHSLRVLCKLLQKAWGILAGYKACASGLSMWNRVRTMQPQDADRRGAPAASLQSCIPLSHSAACLERPAAGACPAGPQSSGLLLYGQWCCQMWVQILEWTAQNLQGQGGTGDES